MNNEVGTALPALAPWASLIHLSLAGPKLLAFRQILGLRSRRTLTLSLVMVGVIAFLPAVFSNVHYMDSKVHSLGLGPALLPLIVYAFWCLVGLLPVSFLWADRDTEHGSHPLGQTMSRAALYLPFGSLLLHMLTLHWLYSVPLHGSYFAPLLLGSAFYLVYSRRPLHGFGRALCDWGAPVTAILLSSQYPDGLVLETSGIVLSPIRVALVAVAVFFALHRIVGEREHFGWAATGAAILAVSGPNFRAMGSRWRELAPESAVELGLMALIAAFALLALGFAVSLTNPSNSTDRRPTLRTKGS